MFKYSKNWQPNVPTKKDWKLFASQEISAKKGEFPYVKGILFTGLGIILEITIFYFLILK